MNIEKKFFELCDQYEYEISQSFQKPEMTYTKEIAEFLTEENGYEPEQFEDCAYVFRTRAPGYLDSSEWSPVHSPEDLEYLFELFFERY